MRLAALLLLASSQASSLVLPYSSPRLLTSPLAPIQSTRPPLCTAVKMQVEAPVKIPDKVPNFAPAKPGSEKANQRGKKFKLLLFNDNVNKSAFLPSPPYVAELTVV